MPTVLRASGYRLFFYSNEAREPPHVHVRKADGYAKVWLESGVVTDVTGFGPSRLREIRAIVEDNKQLLLDAWNEHFHD